VACWFAWRAQLFGLSNPAVYEAQINLDQIYCYTNDGYEDEFICLPSKYKRIDLSEADIERLAAEHSAAAKASQERQQKNVMTARKAMEKAARGAKRRAKAKAVPGPWH